MKNYVWRHRIGLVLLLLLVVQGPFIALKLTAGEDDAPRPLVEVTHVLISSGLAAYLFSKRFDSGLERWLYGGLRKQWQEVRVLYSDGPGKGMGDAYPRDPTLLLQTPPFESEGPHDKGEGVLFAQDSKGGLRNITAPFVHGPVCLSFNTGFVGRPAAGESTWVTGHWSDLQLLQVGDFRMTRVGFPDTLITLGRALDAGE